MLKDLPYKELQKRAKALGLPYTAVKTDELIRSIEEVESNNTNDTQPSVSGDKAQRKQNAPEVKPKKDKKKSAEKSTPYTQAMIINKENHEVRRYTLEVHGKKFKAYAEEFAQKKGYDIEYA